MTRHNMTRHEIATSSIAAIAVSLLPALAAVTTTTLIIMRRSSMIDNMEDFSPTRLPDFAMTVRMLEASRDTVAKVIDMLQRAHGPTEIADFMLDIGRLSDVEIIKPDDSPLVALLENNGHVAAYRKLLRYITQAIDDASALSCFATDDSICTSQLGQIGARTMMAQQAFFDFAAVNVESWLRQRTTLSIIPSLSQTLKTPVAA